MVGSVKPKDWCILAYLNGNNNLEPDLVHNVLDMQHAGSTDQVDVVTQLARAPQKDAHPGKPHDNLDGDWSGVRRYHVEQSNSNKKITSPIVSQLSDNTDMGKVRTLEDFLTWGVQHYPAKHYVFLVSDHGLGYRGVSFDELHDSTIGMAGLQAALKTVEKRTGIKPDVMVFDACMMQQTEVAWQLRDRAKVMVGSEEEIGEDGLPYAQWLGDLEAKPDMSAQELGKTIVGTADADETDRTDDGASDAACQLSAVDLTRLNGLKKAVDQLADALVDSHVKRTKLTHVLQESKRFDKGSRARPAAYFRDLGDLANVLLHSQQITSPAVRKAAQAIQQALSQVVLSNENEGDGMARAHGLSIYLPPQLSKDEAVADDRYPLHGISHYADLDFSHDSHWLRLLHSLDTSPR